MIKHQKFGHVNVGLVADDCAKKVNMSIQRLFEQTMEDLHNGDYYDGR